MLILKLGAFKLCCMCEFSFWIKVCEKLLAFDMCCIMFHSFCFHCDDSRSKCMHVINYLYVASITSCYNLLVCTTIVLHFITFVIFILIWSAFISKNITIAKNQLYTFCNLQKIFNFLLYIHNFQCIFYPMYILPRVFGGSTYKTPVY